MKTNLIILVYHLIIAVLNGYLFLFINNSFIHFNNHKINSLSSIERYFLVLFIAPIIETVVFQFLLYKLIKNKIHNVWIAILLMSFVFSQAHWYHWIYVLMTFFGGIIINHFYVTVYKKEGDWTSFWLTVMLHFCYNFYGLIFID